MKTMRGIPEHIRFLDQIDSRTCLLIGIFFLGPCVAISREYTYRYTRRLGHWLSVLTTDQCFGDGKRRGNWTTRGLPTRGLDISRTGQVADWATRGLNKWPKERKISTQSRRWHLRVAQSATCPVRELTSPRDVQSASRPLRELAYPRVVQ